MGGVGRVGTQPLSHPLDSVTEPVHRRLNRRGQILYAEQAYPLQGSGAPRSSARHGLEVPAEASGASRRPGSTWPPTPPGYASA